MSMGWTRFFRHRWRDERDVRRVLGPDVLERLEARIRESETQHAGQLRLCIEASLPMGHLMRRITSRQRALQLFAALGVWDTEHNSGVLIYLLLADRKIEIVADRGVDRHVGEASWQAIVKRMTHHLSQGLWETALGDAIDAATQELKAHFPRTPGQTQANELPDRPIIL